MANVRSAVYPTVHLDLAKSNVRCQVDLVHCQEVVEHVEEQYIENVLKSLACGKFILLTHALPGQEGHHHVNARPPEYWIEHLRSYNCVLLEEDTRRVRALANENNATYLATTGLLFVNRYDVEASAETWEAHNAEFKRRQLPSQGS